MGIVGGTTRISVNLVHVVVLSTNAHIAVGTTLMQIVPKDKVVLRLPGKGVRINRVTPEKAKELRLNKGF